MRQYLEKCDRRTCFKFILIFLIIVYPFIGAFLGLDLGDTGYHLFAFENLTTNPEKINYTTFFTTVIGHLWNELFGWMGLLAFNFLEVLLEWSIVIIVYRTFKDVLGELCVLAGSLLSVMAADTYLNIFNYHQFNALLLTVILCLQYKAIINEDLRLSFASGIVYVLLVFSRVGSVVAIMTFFLYLYDTIMHDRDWKLFGKHLVAYMAGALISLAFFIGILCGSGLGGYFVDNIFRLGNIASDNSTAYGFKNLLYTLISENLKVMASGFICVCSMLIASIGMSIAFTPSEKKLKKLFYAGLALVIMGVCIYEIYFAYDINPAEPWPQMTTGQKFIIGVMYVIAFIYYAMNAFKKNEKNRRRTLIIISAYLLVILTIAGSNTGTKHVILGLWIMAPIFVAALRAIFARKNVEEFGGLFHKITGLKLLDKSRRWVLVVFLTMFMAKFLHMVYFTFNYDSVNRTELTATVNCQKVAGILTTQREADAVNGALEAIEENSEEDEPLMVFGSSLLFYYMTEKESYTTAWVTPNTYSLEQYKKDLATAKENYGDTLPVVLFCRTNYSYGFDEEKLGEIYMIENNSFYDGKKDEFINFLRDNSYDMKYINDYYMVLAPGEGKDFEQTEKIIRGE